RPPRPAPRREGPDLRRRDPRAPRPARGPRARGRFRAGGAAAHRRARRSLRRARTSPMSDDLKITTEKRGPLFLIGLNRPKKMNAFDAEMLRALSRAFELLE